MSNLDMSKIVALDPQTARNLAKQLEKVLRENPEEVFIGISEGEDFIELWTSNTTNSTCFARKP